MREPCYRGRLQVGEEEEWWVDTVRAEEEEEDLEEVENSESEENKGREVRFLTSTCMRKDWKTSWSTSGRLPSLETPTNEKKTDGGPRDLRSQAPRRRSNTSPTCLASGPRRRMSGRESLLFRLRERQVSAGAITQPRRENLTRIKEDPQRFPKV
jgi:hypothetical protein